ncbi:MAG TPA: GNAT family N-acetyltransferase [Rhizomicrobium sp.]|jgi:GNAT superfamily N-acetyltransferase|nr:GNAT family N-acetyltransferase [Rhizomicrobium sp.]
MQIVEVTEGKGAICAAILATLPDWFGMPQSNAAYIRDVETMPVWAAAEGGARFGFLALKQPTPMVFEIHVMGVTPGRHRAGAGRALVDAAAAHARARGARALTVKTLSARDPDAGYARTRLFYEAMGFWPVDELPEELSPGNPQVLLLKRLD